MTFTSTFPNGGTPVVPSFNNLHSIFSSTPYSSEKLDHIHPSSSMCSVCTGQGHRRVPSQERVPGSLAWLPSRQRLERMDLTHCVDQQVDILNDGAFNHPAVVLKKSKCQHLVYCAPCTSFGGQSLQEKYSKARPLHDVFYQYLSIKSSNSHPHSALGELVLENGVHLDKSTYVHLTEAYWIEEWALDTVNGQAQQPYKLDDHSLAYVRWAYNIVNKHNRMHDLTSRRQLTRGWPSHQRSQSAGSTSSSSSATSTTTTSTSSTFSSASSTSFSSSWSSGSTSGWQGPPLQSFMRDPVTKQRNLKSNWRARG